MIKRFLLIDDDRDDRDLFVEALAEIDDAILCDLAEDGREAINKLESKTFARPNVIFLDVNMPVMSGWECLLQLKRNDNLKNVPVIMYSTSSHSRDRQIAAELGASYFFTKPNGFGELISFINATITSLQNNTPIIFG